MATYKKLPLSFSNNGKQILINSTDSGSATPIHTSVSGTVDWDEIYIYAYNNGSSSIQLSLLWGGTNEPNDVMKVSILPKAGRLLIVDGKLLQNSLLVSAYSAVSGSIVVDGFVNRITS